MKNKSVLILMLICCYGSFLHAQQAANSSRSERYERVQAAKIGYLTEKVSLSESEAQKFWPVYNDYQQSRSKIFHEIRMRIRTGKSDGVTAEEKNKLLDETMALKEKELELQKNFKDKVLTIISVDQYINLLSAEKEFNKILMERLGNRKKPD